MKRLIYIAIGVVVGISALYLISFFRNEAKTLTDWTDVQVSMKKDDSFFVKVVKYTSSKKERATLIMVNDSTGDVRHWVIPNNKSEFLIITHKDEFLLDFEGEFLKLGYDGLLEEVNNDDKKNIHNSSVMHFGGSVILNKQSQKLIGEGT